MEHMAELFAAKLDLNHERLENNLEIRINVSSQEMKHELAIFEHKTNATLGELESKLAMPPNAGQGAPHGPPVPHPPGRPPRQQRPQRPGGLLLEATAPRTPR
jgi:hypothetical protein